MSTPSNSGFSVDINALRESLFDSKAGRVLLKQIEKLAVGLTAPVTLMEVCGTHTHAIAAAGLRRLMPEKVRLVSGPGCPVCVTPIGWVDHAVALAALPDVIVTTFGDLMRVPSSTGTLEEARAGGSDIRICYSTRDALQIARDNPERRVIFLAVGFETTAPTIAGALAEAEKEGLPNFMILPGNKTMPGPLRVLVDDETVDLNGLLCPGHVSVIIGSDAYQQIAAAGVPCAVVGFAPNDVLTGVIDLLEQILGEKSVVTNLYKRVVKPGGNPAALQLLDHFFETTDADWRGLGPIADSGLKLRPAYAHRDASLIDVDLPIPQEPKGCRCGEVLRGTINPPDCPLFGKGCDPQHAVGACMVSSEGTCAAWYRHERLVTT
ncbi:MAG: hydrogenase formation protein HypD [Planctomycetes bacterium]|nr:hydrogenase formation protein HypD [Planctomycetota bacterium]